MTEHRLFLHVYAVVKAEEGQDAKALLERIVSGALKPLAVHDRADTGLLVCGVGRAWHKGETP